ncbi:MAG: dehydrogenase [Prevotella sp.]|nr:dehydrogenase [Prevotella sp.]
MADGYLEKRQQDYEARKAEYLRKKKHLPKVSRKIECPEDEAL